MSAITGIGDLRAMAAAPRRSSADGTATRTIWQPDAVSSAICCSVAFTSAVSVVVIDYRHRRVPAHRHVPDHDLPGLPAGVSRAPLTVVLAADAWHTQ